MLFLEDLLSKLQRITELSLIIIIIVYKFLLV